jgi:hypothetical protein
MPGPDKTIKVGPNDRLVRVLLPNGEGAVDIVLGLTKDDGQECIRVDVASDSERYGPDRHGRTWAVENGNPGPGVVFLIAQKRAGEGE